MTCCIHSEARIRSARNKFQWSFQHCGKKSKTKIRKKEKKCNAKIHFFRIISKPARETSQLSPRTVLDKWFVVFLPRTLHTNSIYNFCTFVLSFFIFILHIQLLYNAFLFTHARSSTLDWHRHQSSQLDSFSLFIASLPFSSWRHLSSSIFSLKLNKILSTVIVVPPRRRHRLLRVCRSVDPRDLHTRSYTQ